MKVSEEEKRRIIDLHFNKTVIQTRTEDQSDKIQDLENFCDILESINLKNDNHFRFRY